MTIFFTSDTSGETADTVRIELTKGYFTVVDRADAHDLLRHSWSALIVGRQVYATRSARSGGRKRQILMHRQIMRFPPNLLVDHEDGDTLNNRRGNLRIATKSQNGLNRGKQSNNSSGFKGVSWSTRNQKWSARIKIDSTYKFLGYFTDLAEAAKVYAEWAERHHGSFMRK